MKMEIAIDLNQIYLVQSKVSQQMCQLVNTLLCPHLVPVNCRTQNLYLDSYLTAAIMTVLQFPPRESFRSLVNLLSL